MQIFTLKKWAKFYLPNQNRVKCRKIVYVEKTVPIGSIDMEKSAVKNHVTHI